MDALKTGNWNRHWDLLVVLAVCIVLTLAVLAGVESPWLWPLSIGFLLVFPGYLILGLIFPWKGSLSGKERFILSSVLSMAIIPVAGFILNYIIDLEETTVILIMFSFNLYPSLFLMYLRDRYVNAYSPSPVAVLAGAVLSSFRSKGRFEQALAVLITIMLLACLVAVAFIISRPVTEDSSEFYLLADDGSIINFPNNVTVGEELNLTVGIVNHEGREVNYTVQAWVVQAEYVQGQATVHHMWFNGSHTVVLSPVDKGMSDEYEEQWEHQMTFSFDATGEYRVWFFMFLDHPDEGLNPGQDYAGTLTEDMVQRALDNEVYNVYLDLSVLA